MHSVKITAMTDAGKNSTIMYALETGCNVERKQWRAVYPNAWVAELDIYIGKTWTYTDFKKLP